MQCLQCQHKNREGRRFCAECGAPLDLSCSSCGFVNEPGEKFCGGCGVSLTGQPSAPASSKPTPQSASDHEPLSYTPQHLAEKILTSRSALEGERKQVTVLFCDSANSTAIAEKIGPESMHALLALEYGFTGRLRQGVHHGEQTVALLESTAEHAWLGMSWYYLGCAYVFAGALHRALHTGTQSHTIGETIGDRRLQVNGLAVIGWSYGLQGEWDLGIEALQHALVVSPDAFETAVVIGRLGHQPGHRHHTSEHRPRLVHETPGAKVGRENRSAGS